MVESIDTPQGDQVERAAATTARTTAAAARSVVMVLAVTVDVMVGRSLFAFAPSFLAQAAHAGEPRNGAPPKANTPPSWATSQ